tara:strand:+ start:35 stop:1789 length:1755 start_codon:yes stop_codon:yes gene_type:complete
MESGQQRLFRLTSNSSDGLFDTTFNQDIQIKAGSTVALQSVSFDRVSDEITIDAANNLFTFGLINKAPIVNWTTRIPNGLFPKVNRGEELLENISRALNARINMSQADKNFTSNGFSYSINKGSQWKMNLGADGLAVIRAKTDRPCLVSNSNWASTNAFKDTTVLAETMAGAAPIISEPTELSYPDSYISRPLGSAIPYSGDKNHSYVYGKVRMTKGTGVIRTRIRDLVASTATEHSFTMGLTTDAGKLQLGTLTNADIHYGLQCHQPDEAYHFKPSVSTAFIKAELPDGADLLPLNFIQGAGDYNILNENDMLEIRIDGTPGVTSASPNATRVGMSVHQRLGDGTDRETRLGEDTIQDISQDTDWYWFVSFNQDGSTLKLDMLEADLDAYAFTQEPPAFAADEPRSTLTTVIRSVTKSDQAELTTANRQVDFNFATIELARYCGYSATQQLISNVTPFSATQDYKLFAEIRAEFSIEAKNYLILFDNIPLESFDTYSQHSLIERNANTGGSRRNLLSCVPTKEDLVAGSSISRVVYEPSSLQYISMNNRNAMITRALKCRLVTSTYQPVAIDGLASMTLLIKD